jgi:predicted RNA binding protein YcfA (HicA-like mRNA interferase family)
MPTTVEDIVRCLKDDGWTLVASRGSHRQFTHKDQERPGHRSRQSQRRLASGHAEEHFAAGRPQGLTPCVTLS